MASAATVTSIRPVIAEDDGVRERHGVSNFDGTYVSAVEEGDALIAVTVKAGQYSVETVTISAAKARYIAGRLYRLARRIERRRVSA
jgi:hypothetical protein